MPIQMTGESAYERGSRLADEGRTEEAEAAYREAADAGDPDAWFQLGWLLAAQPERAADAEAAYREAIAGGRPLAWGYLGELLEHRPGRAADAETAYRAAIEAGG